MVWGAALGGIAGLVGQGQANRANRREAQKNRAFQERMRNTQWQAAVEDMKAAGLNPALAYSQGPNAAPGGSQASPMGNVVSSAMQGARFKKELALLDAQVEEQKAKADSAGFQAWKDRQFQKMLENPTTMRWRTSDGNQVDVTTPGINHWLKARVDQDIQRAAQLRGQAQLYGATGNIANTLTEAFDGPLRAYTGMASGGLMNAYRGIQQLDGLSDNARRWLAQEWKKLQGLFNTGGW